MAKTATENKSFTYNLLNLPLVATVPGGTITYTYDAEGNKLRKVSTVNNNSTDYISGIQYDGATMPALSFIQTEEGKAVPLSAGGYDYTYYLGDNLGNTRITFDTKTGAAVILQTDDYYPFGLEIPGAITSPKNKYLYNEKDLQDELTEYDYGARFYDPVIARWTTPDLLAELHNEATPYNYVLNNPIANIDIMGLDTAKSIYNVNDGSTAFIDANGIIQQLLKGVTITSKKEAKSKSNNDSDQNSSDYEDFDKEYDFLDKVSFSHHIKGKDKNGRSICGHCALVVRLSLEAGGMNTSDRPKSTKSAKNYGPYLTKKGYKVLDPNNYKPKKGDKRVWQPYKGGDPNGHIDSYDGHQWVSDFKESNSSGPGPGYRNDPNFEIYRKDQ